MKGPGETAHRKKTELNFAKRAIFREERKKARDSGERVGDLSWLSELPEERLFEEWEKISARLTQELEQAKLWHRDNDKIMIPNENGIPSVVKSRIYGKEDEEGGDDFFDTDEFYAPDAVDDVIGNGEILDEEVIFEEESEEIVIDEWDLRLIGPRAAFSNMQVLMRRPPKDLNQSIARDLIDSKYFLQNEPKSLLPANCFYEVGIEDEATFSEIRAQVYVGGPFHEEGKEFYFSEYQRDKLKLSHVLRRQKQLYFDHNRMVWRSAARIASRPEEAMKSLWERLLNTLSSLTPKQRNAVREVLIKGRPQTRVAQTMRITIDSLRDRLEGARVKFQNNLPELAAFRPSETYKESKIQKRLYWGLHDKEEAQKIRPLYRIHLKTQERAEISRRNGKPTAKPNINVAAIKAWALTSTPVPDFGFTDYFTKLLPQGHRDRSSTSNTPHDRGACYPNYENKVTARILTDSMEEGEDC